MYVLVIDDSARLTLRKLRPWRRLLARLQAGKLDQGLARGDDPESSVYLGARAQQLVSPRFRRGLAASLRRLLAGSSCRQPSRWMVSGPDWQASACLVSWTAVAQAAADLAWLAERLEVPGPVPVRGVALTCQLLSEITGPLYTDLGPGALRGAAQQAVSALADRA